MRVNVLITSIVAALVVLPSVCNAQDTIHKRSFLGRLLFQEDTASQSKKKFDFTIVAGPNYASDIKFAIGLVASGKYYTVRDGKTSPSTVSQFASVSTTGFYTTAIRGNTFFRGDKNRIDYELRFYSFPSDFWGFGYYNADNDKKKSSYKRKQDMFKADFLHELIPK